MTTIVSVVNLAAGQEQEVIRLAVGQEPFGVAIDEGRGIAFVVNRRDAILRFIDLRSLTPPALDLSVNLPFVPTEVALVPGISGALRLLTTDVAGTNVGVTEISSSVLP